MNLLPFVKFHFETSYRFVDVVSIITENTETESHLWKSTDKKYRGSIKSDSFKITPNITYRNSFLPVMVGRIEPTSLGSSVSVKMRLNKFVIGFLCCWFSLIAVACVNALSNMDNFSLSVLLPFFMLVFGAALVFGSFCFEAPKQKEKLVQLLTIEQN